jgi:cysteinyl-tRNA synthetase
MHNGYLNINNEKMSKSLGNGLSVKEILKTTKSEAVRYVILSTHYRSPLNYSEDSIRQAEAGIERLNNSQANVRYRLETAGDGAADAAVEAAVAAVWALFHEKMNDDFNTADAITALFELAGTANRYLQQEQVTKATLELVLDAFGRMDRVLGLLAAPQEELVDEEVDRLIAERNTARKAKDWARADEIRELLTERGIILEDTPQGLRWRRK